MHAKNEKKKKKEKQNKTKQNIERSMPIKVYISLVRESHSKRAPSLAKMPARCIKIE